MYNVVHLDLSFISLKHLSLNIHLIENIDQVHFTECIETFWTAETTWTQALLTTSLFTMWPHIDVWDIPQTYSTDSSSSPKLRFQTFLNLDFEGWKMSQLSGFFTESKALILMWKHRRWCYWAGGGTCLPPPLPPARCCASDFVPLTSNPCWLQCMANIPWPCGQKFFFVNNSSSVPEIRV